MIETRRPRLPWLLLVLGALLPASMDAQIRENCRLFAAMTGNPDLSPQIQAALTAFAEPSIPQNAGWSIACYGDVTRKGKLAVPGYPQVIRSHVPIRQDQAGFLATVELVTRMKPEIVVGHLRNASSGCSDVADPHPFLRRFDGRWYLFAHNGGVWGQDLEILRDELLAGWAEPESCPDDPIDSEYLFLYLLKIMDQEQLGVPEALGRWAARLRGRLAGEWNALNVILTDGETLWALRCVRQGSGFQLHHRALDLAFPGFVISTEGLHPDSIPLQNNRIGIFRPFQPPEIRGIPLVTTGSEPGSSTGTGS